MEEKLQYAALSGELQERIRQDRENHWENPWQCREEAALRRDMERDKATLWRPAFVRDSEKIMHLPLYNRYADKTHVSFHVTCKTQDGPTFRYARIRENPGTRLNTRFFRGKPLE